MFLAIASFATPSTWDNPLFNLLLCPCLVYLAVLIGMTPMPELPFYRGGDYSYGIYLYGFPIQQAVILAGLGNASAWQNFLISTPLILLFAFVSWHLIERKRFADAL